jgi:hypothetical protein
MLATLIAKSCSIEEGMPWGLSGQPSIVIPEVGVHGPFLSYILRLQMNFGVVGGGFHDQSFSLVQFIFSPFMGAVRLSCRLRHTTRNTPEPVRFQKLSLVRPVSTQVDEHLGTLGAVTFWQPFFVFLGPPIITLARPLVVAHLSTNSA